MSIDCDSTQRRVLALLDGALPQDVAADVRSHMAGCPDCSKVFERGLTGRQAMRSLPKMRVPAELTTSLRVLASREHARQSRWRSWPEFATATRQSFSLWFNNLMKPLALPFAGGLMTATLVFSSFISAYPLSGTNFAYDVPIWPKERNSYIEATLRTMAPLEFTGADLTIDLVIDKQGRVLDYRVEGGTANNPAARRTIENILLFSEFNPATASGQRTYGKVRVSFRRSSQIEVRG